MQLQIKRTKHAKIRFWCRNEAYLDAAASTLSFHPHYYYSPWPSIPLNDNRFHHKRFLPQKCMCMSLGHCRPWSMRYRCGCAPHGWEQVVRSLRWLEQRRVADEHSIQPAPESITVCVLIPVALCWEPRAGLQLESRDSSCGIGWQEGERAIAMKEREREMEAGGRRCCDVGLWEPPWKQLGDKWLSCSQNYF